MGPRTNADATTAKLAANKTNSTINGEILALAVVVGSIILLIATATNWLDYILMPVTEIASSELGQSLTDNFAPVALLLNLALIALAWRRFANLKQEVQLRTQAEEKARQLAATDALTGFANRRELMQAGASLAREYREQGRQMAVMMIDMDGFKGINDLYGHAAGDTVLAATADRMRAVMPSDSLMGRLGGDEFVIVMSCTHDCQQIDDMGRALVNALAQPVDTAKARVPVSCSIGLSIGPVTDDGIGVGLRRADYAMYIGKERGRNRLIRFDDTMEQALKTRDTLDTALRAALENGELYPVYEPQVNLSTGLTIGYEMLARWNSPVLGQVPPAEFVPVAEKAGLINRLSEVMMHQAFADAVHWPGHLHLSINISPIQLRDPWFAQKLLRVITETGIAPSRIIVEITESALTDNMALARASIMSLKNQGIRVALDDFGTGYASLANLRQLPFDSVKIDRNFVTAMQAEGNNLSIVEAVLQLGHSLGMPVVAEGVENSAIADSLSGMACETGQGRLYGVPLTATEVLARQEQESIKSEPEAAERAA